MRHRVPLVPTLVDGLRVARRGSIGSPLAGTWVSIEPGWEVMDSDEGVLVRHYASGCIARPSVHRQAFNLRPGRIGVAFCWRRSSRNRQCANDLPRLLHWRGISLPPAPRTSLLDHLDFRRLSNFSGGTMTKITAKIRLKMAAPIRADVRTEASKKEWATYPTVIAMVDAQTATRKFMILDITRLCAPLRVNCAWCLAERAIYLL